MSLYFQQKKSMCTGEQWSSKVHGQGWKLIYNQWENCNKQLHDTLHIADMEGIQQVKQAVKEEYKQGL